MGPVSAGFVFANFSSAHVRRWPKVGGGQKVAGRKRRYEEATRTAPAPAEPHGPRRCGGPEHSVGLSKEIVRFPGRSPALGTSFHSAISPWLKASGTAAEINAEAFAAMWKLPSTTKIVLTD